MERIKDAIPPVQICEVSSASGGREAALYITARPSKLLPERGESSIRLRAAPACWLSRAQGVMSGDLYGGIEAAIAHVRRCVAGAPLCDSSRTSAAAAAPAVTAARSLHAGVSAASHSPLTARRAPAFPLLARSLRRARPLRRVPRVQPGGKPERHRRSGSPAAAAARGGGAPLRCAVQRHPVRARCRPKDTHAPAPDPVAPRRPCSGRFHAAPPAPWFRFYRRTTPKPPRLSNPPPPTQVGEPGPGAARPEPPAAAAAQLPRSRERRPLPPHGAHIAPASTATSFAAPPWFGQWAGSLRYWPGGPAAG